MSTNMKFSNSLPAPLVSPGDNIFRDKALTERIGLVRTADVTDEYVDIYLYDELAPVRLSTSTTLYCPNQNHNTELLP